MSDLCGADGVAKAWRRLAILKDRMANRPDLIRTLGEESMRCLAPLPAADVDEAVTRWIDGVAGPGDGWAPTLTELLLEAQRVGAEHSCARPGGGCASVAAGVRRRVGGTPTFVGRHDPGWAAWEAWARRSGETMPPPIQTINGFGSYFRSALPPETSQLGTG